MNTARSIKNLAIIPARSGSKRIPGKNIKSFLGKPLLGWTIENTKNVKIFDEVIVSTDSQSIAELAISYGASIPFMRSQDSANDFSTLSDVLSEVLLEYQKLNIEVLSLCCILPTAVFASSNLIERGMMMMYQHQCDSVIPVIKYGHPIQRALSIQNDLLRFKYPEFCSTRTQDLESSFFDSGMFYCVNVAAFLANNQIFMKNTIGMEVPEKFAQDIDTDEDWKYAEIKYQVMQQIGDSL